MKSKLQDHIDAKFNEKHEILIYAVKDRIITLATVQTYNITLDATILSPPVLSNNIEDEISTSLALDLRKYSRQN